LAGKASVEDFIAASIAAGLIVMPSACISGVRPEAAVDPDEAELATVEAPDPLSMSMACMPAAWWPGTAQ